ncbi:MAG TPA: DMT family transporter [Candidatus Dormibacteraeota bacterium]|nr:DMT family transporter [Candidatus Dormibacteraeota bacterium]
MNAGLPGARASGHAGSLLKAALAVTFWGASFVATKIALREMSPVALVWARFALGLPVLGVFVLARRQLRPISRGDFGYFLLLGFLAITFHQWLQSNGLLTAQATTTGWIVATSPLFIAILGRLFLREKLGLLGILGILVAAFGVLLIVAKGDPRAIAIGWGGTPGDTLILISALNWAVVSVISRRGLKRHPAALMMFYVMLLGWLLTTVLFAASGFHGLGHLTLSGWVALLFLGFLCSGVAYVFWYDALERIPAWRVGAFLYLEPLITVAVAAAVLGEAVRGGTMIGGAITLFGLWLVNRKRAG